MESYVMRLLSIDYISLLSAVAIIIVASVAIKEAFEKFCKAFGIELSYLREKEEMKTCQTQVKKELAQLQERQGRFEEEHRENVKARDEFNQEVMELIEGLKNDIKNLGDHIEKREAEKRFKNLRNDILNFADRIPKSEHVSAELVEQMFDEIQDYENLVSVYNFKNNRVNASIAVITAKYQEMLLQGKITKRMEDD